MQDPSCMGLHYKSNVVAKRPPVGVVWKFGERMAARVLISSSNRGSKLRSPRTPSPNSSSTPSGGRLTLDRLDASPACIQTVFRGIGPRNCDLPVTYWSL
ncbi:hypothetical protein AVEN_96870-1 [Araneus ventricosus]|uniref:Uncharacterized protein n=1 Tax=Araneus ventricosus TaxID=182803 RepID=A0A4Y2Q4C5_ARAVE|nr:hypothetical protein AVEN_96870-1 [Araneus ventricosus]